MNTRRWIVLVAALALSLLTARLGLWQLDRADQKTRMQQSLQAQRALAALTQRDLGMNADELRAQVYRAVRLQGRWLPEHTVYLDNRQMNGRTGFYAVTPLLLDDGTAVLVQRGWLPRDQMDRTRIQALPLPAGPVTVQGRVALSPSRMYEFDGTVEGPIRQNLDVSAFARETRLRLRPLTVLQETSTNEIADDLKRDWPAPATGVEKHHGYAFQWFAISALTAGLWLWFQVIQPRRRRLGTTAHAPAHLHPEQLDDKP
jgi:surfeit locus 1 family protein